MTVRETERWGEVASGEWRDKGEERFLASLGMTVSFASLKGNEWPIERAVQKDEIQKMQERLQKIISRSGIASRRHAEQLILSGQVRVNGRVITELGSKADLETDRIEAAGKRVAAQDQKVVLLLHKPPQVVSTMADPERRKTLRNFLRGLPERVYPVGRLDYGSSGLVLLTNDGELANRLLKAAHAIPQTYWIKVKGRLDEALLSRAKREAGAELHPLKQPTASRG